MNNKPITIEIYQCGETDEYFVTDSSGEFDGFSTFCEQEANDEAESWADELGGVVVRV